MLGHRVYLTAAVVTNIRSSGRMSLKKQCMYLGIVHHTLTLIHFIVFYRH